MVNFFYTIINAFPGVMAGGYLSLFNSMWNDTERTEDVLPQRGHGLQAKSGNDRVADVTCPPEKEKGSGRSRVPTPICNVCGTFLKIRWYYGTTVLSPSKLPA